MSRGAGNGALAEPGVRLAEAERELALAETQAVLAAAVSEDYREQLTELEEAIAEAGIPFEIVPGVSSIAAVPASALVIVGDVVRVGVSLAAAMSTTVAA